jgi:hypothetical protein
MQESTKADLQKNRLSNKFEMSQSMINNKKGVVGNKNSVRTLENIHCIMLE